MKRVEISERGIKIIENKEVINQALFQTVEEIPYEIGELLSIYEEREEIELKIELELDEQIIEEIKSTLKGEGWKLKSSKKINKKYIFIICGAITTISIIYSIILNIIISGYDESVQIKEKEERVLKKELMEINKKMEKFEKLESKEEIVDEENILDENELSRYLEFFSTISKKTGVNFNEIEFQKNKVLVKGESNKTDNVFKLKNYITDSIQIKDVKFDYIKREGGKVIFLIEFESY